jgi:hypothetical protein
MTDSITHAQISVAKLTNGWKHAILGLDMKTTKGSSPSISEETHRKEREL